MKFIDDYKRAKVLLAEDNLRLEREKKQSEKLKKMKKEALNLKPEDINYVTFLTMFDVAKKEANLATFHREVNRIMVMLCLKAPTIYKEVFGEKPQLIFDTVWLKDDEGTLKAHSLKSIEKLFETESKNDKNWPPQEANPKFFSEAAYCSFLNTCISNIKKLEKFLEIVNSYS